MILFRGCNCAAGNIITIATTSMGVKILWAITVTIAVPCSWRAAPPGVVRLAVGSRAEPAVFNGRVRAASIIATGCRLSLVNEVVVAEREGVHWRLPPTCIDRRSSVDARPGPQPESWRPPAPALREWVSCLSPVRPVSAGSNVR